MNSPSNHVLCPFCGTLQKNPPSKSWDYGKIIEARTKEKTTWGASVKCSRYKCKCEKSFGFYLSTNGKFWTIPKPNNIKKTTNT